MLHESTVGAHADTPRNRPHEPRCGLDLRSPHGKAAEAERKGGCIPPTPGDPVSIPHDIENGGVTTGIDEDVNLQVSGPFLPPPQAVESTRSALSRWRHGFEPRWDYQEETRRRSSRLRPGQGAHTGFHATTKVGSSTLSGLGRPSLVPHLSRGRRRHVTFGARPWPRCRRKTISSQRVIRRTATGRTGRRSLGHIAP